MRPIVCGALITSLWFLGCGGPSPITNCEPDGDIIPICGFKNPEDLVALPGGAWLLVSQFGDPETGGGSLEAYRVVDQHRQTVFPLVDGEAGSEASEEADTSVLAAGWGSESCPGPPDPAVFSPHGIDLARADGGAARLAVVNHGGREAIELFEVALGPEGPALAWRGCVPLPEGDWANDVLALPGGVLMTSRMLPVPGFNWASISASFSVLTGGDTGVLLEWRPGGEWVALEGSNGSAPNGLAVSRDGAQVFFAEWGGERLVRLSRDASGALQRDIAPLPHHPDNLTWTRRGHLLVAGQGGGIFDVLGCGALERGTCDLPYSVVEIDPMTLETRVLLEHTGAASVALEVGDEIFVGTFAGDRLVRAPYPH